MQHSHPLLVILAVVALAPLVGELPIRLRLPIVVMEVVLGIAIGPYVLAHADSLVRVPLFLGLFLLVRGGLVLFYRQDLNRRDRLALALYSATALPLVVAICTIGTATGRMRPENAAALIGAGIVSVLLFSLAALLLRGGASTAQSEQKSER